MGRLDRRIQRIAQRAREVQASRVEAQLAQMSDSELMDRLIKAALVLGMPEELAQGQLEAIVSWGREYQPKAEDAQLLREPDRL